MKGASAEHLAKLEAAVRSRIGFDTRSVGEEVLPRVLYRRMADEGVSDVHRYIAGLLLDKDRFDSFVEGLIVPETWFFRDRRPFRHLQQRVGRQRGPGRNGKCFRVLSLPCSTGEEPYSIAMVLLDVGLAPSEFQVDGADLSRRALARASEAVWSKSSFRGDEAAFPGLRERYFQRRGNTYVAGDVLRKTVRFVRANLISPSLLENEPGYDAIFCRNLLIYMDADAQRAGLANLHRLLAPAGLLYVGHVEARIAMEGPFHQADREYPFAFSPSDWKGQTKDDESGSCDLGTQTRTRRKQPAKFRPTGEGGARRGAEAPSEDGVEIAVGSEVEDETLAAKLSSVRKAADGGRLEEADGLCREVLEKDPANADALCLMGLVAKVRGATAEAEGFFQKALYVEPGHKETLVHMMLLAQQRGDGKAADNFRRRSERGQGREAGR